MPANHQYDDITLEVGQTITTFDEAYAAEERQLCVEVAYCHRAADCLPVRGTISINWDGSMTIGDRFLYTERQFQEILLQPESIVFGVAVRNYMRIVESSRAEPPRNRKRFLALFKRS